MQGSFHQYKNRKDVLPPHCISCKKQYYNENRNRLINKQKFYNKENHDQIKEYQKKYKKQYFKNRKKSYLNFKKTCNLRSRTSTAFKSQNVRKTNKTFDLLGCSHSFFQRWIIHQLSGEMTLDYYGSVWVIDHCYPLSKTNLSNNVDMIKATNWINLKSMYSSENISKVSKIDLRLYLMQEIKANCFKNINEDGLNQGFY